MKDFYRINYEPVFEGAKSHSLRGLHIFAILCSEWCFSTPSVHIVILCRVLLERSVEASQGAIRFRTKWSEFWNPFGVKACDASGQRVHFHFPFLMVFVFFFTSFLSSLLGCSRGACVPSSFLPWTLSRLWNACHDSQLFSGSRDIVQKLTALNMSLTHGGLPSTLPADVLAELKETAAKLCSPGTWTQHVSSVDSNCKPNITMQKMSSSWGAITYLSWNECFGFVSV